MPAVVIDKTKMKVRATPLVTLKNKAAGYYDQANGVILLEIERSVGCQVFWYSSELGHGFGSYACVGMQTG